VHGAASFTISPWCRITRTAQTGPSPGLTHAAVRPVIPAIRCNCKICGERGFEMGSNAVERTIRPIALQRKNALFAGHDAGAQNWAMLASLIETCKLNKIEPHSYITCGAGLLLNLIHCIWMKTLCEFS
jgi:hypothetical protein